MKSLIATIIVVFSINNSFAGTSQKLEGSCSGTLKDGTAISYEYFSNFDGCKKVSTAVVSFTAGREGLYTGKRSFKGGKDIYSFMIKEGRRSKEHVRLTFADSTGNTSGSIRYLNDSGKFSTVQMSCEVRDYEYSDC